MEDSSLFTNQEENKENKDNSNNQDSALPSSPIAPLTPNDDYINTQSQFSELNSYIHMLSPLQEKNNKKIDAVLCDEPKNDLNKVINSNPYISSSIKTKINKIIIENSSSVPQFKSLIYPNGNNNYIDSLLHNRKTKAKKNEIMNMLNMPLNNKKKENIPMSRNKTAQIQKILNNFFIENKTVSSKEKYPYKNLHSYRSNKNINQIKREEENFEVNLYKNQFNLHSKLHSQFEIKNKQFSTNNNIPFIQKNTKLYIHKKTNSCFC